VIVGRLSGVSKAFGSSLVLEGVSLEIHGDRRVGLTGRNGTGKTTIFRLLTGEIEPDEGEVWRQRDAKFAMMRQVPSFEEGSTVEGVARRAFASLHALAAEAEGVRAELASPGRSHDEALLARLADLDARFEHLGGFEIDFRIRAVLAGVGFRSEDFSKPTAVLSGGEKNRLALAEILLDTPDLLLLDEPTNHLDLAGIEWLERYLKAWKGGVVLISHDRFLLEAVTEETLDLSARRVTSYPAPYRRAMEMKAETRRVEEKHYALQREEIARQEDFIRRNIAGQNFRQAQSRRKWLDRLERLERPESEERGTAMRIPVLVRSGNDVLLAERLGARIGERVLYRNLSLRLERGDRIGVLGPNGTGKTTLLACLSGRRKPDEGSIVHGTGVMIGFLDQELRSLVPTNTVLEEVHALRPLAPEGEMRSYLARFLFSGDEVFRPVRVLSGGESCRLALAKLFLQGPNLIFLDEPTNHLDIEGREALERALEDYEGTVVAVSHDRAFLANFAEQVWVLHDGRVDVFLGGYAAFDRARTASSDGEATNAKVEAEKSSAHEDRKKEKRAREREVRDRERRAREVEAIEREIHVLDEALARSVEELSRPDLGADDRRRAAAEHADLERRKDALYTRWEAAVEEGHASPD